MNRVGVDDDGSGHSRAGELTRAAADAILLVDFRIENIFLVHKTDSMRRADFPAGAAIIIIDENNANIF